MAMNSNASTGDVMSELNITPLIDVMLVLLVLLLVTLPVQTHAVNLVIGNRLPAAPLPPVATVDVSFDGALFLNGKPTNREYLQAYFVSAARQEPQPVVHVEADKLAKYDMVAKVMADAQRLGMRSMAIVNTAPDAGAAN